MKKLTSRKELNKITKSALAMVLAGAFTFSATTAFADEVTNTTDEFQSSEVQAEGTAADEIVVPDAANESPSLLPGDFFYFAKIAFEKIQLALTFDDVKEAKLLASIASERLAEAEGLFSAGDEEAALKSIKAAMEDMKSSDKAVEDQPASDQSAVEVNEDSQTDENEIKDVSSQNIIALTAAMEKVKNPVAKAALQKNIDKSYKRLAKKIEKWEQKLAKKQEKEAKEKEKENEKETLEQEAIEQSTNDGIEKAKELEATREMSTTTDTVVKEANPDASKGQKAGHEVQIIQKAAHQEFKQSQAVAKQQRKEVKQQTKEKKQEVKQHKQEGKSENKDNQKKH